MVGSNSRSGELGLFQLDVYLAGSCPAYGEAGTARIYNIKGGRQKDTVKLSVVRVFNVDRAVGIEAVEEHPLTEKHAGAGIEPQPFPFTLRHNRDDEGRLSVDPIFEDCAGWSSLANLVGI